MIANLPTVSRTNLLLPCFNMICTCREKTLEPSFALTFPPFPFSSVRRFPLNYFFLNFIFTFLELPFSSFYLKFLLSSLFSDPSYHQFLSIAKLITMFLTDFSFSCWCLELRLIGLHHCLLLFVFLRLQPMTRSAQKRNCNMGSQ